MYLSVHCIVGDVVLVRHVQDVPITTSFPLHLSSCVVLLSELRSRARKSGFICDDCAH